MCNVVIGPLFPDLKNYAGLLHLKSQQDSSTSEAPYIRLIAEFPELGFSQDDDGDEDMDNEPLQIAVCMSQSSSARLLRAHYLQSDIGFKCIVGFKEFELGGLDENSSTSMFIYLYTLVSELIISRYRSLQNLCQSSNSIGSSTHCPEN